MKDKKNIVDLLQNDNNFNNSLQEIINLIASAENENIESELLALLKTILEAFGNNIDNFPSLESISESQKKALIEELKKIILALNNLSKEDAIELLAFGIIKISNNLFNKKYKGDDLFEISEKDRKQIEKELKIAAIIEEYIAINPIRMAGETEKDNFKSNLERKGLDFAIKYAKEDRNSVKELLNQIKREHKMNQSKDGRSL